jgi:hypothetical protein
MHERLDRQQLFRGCYGLLLVVIRTVGISINCNGETIFGLLKRTLTASTIPYAGQ